MGIREVAGVYIDSAAKELTWWGEVVKVPPIVADAINHLMDAVENKPIAQRIVFVDNYSLDLRTGWLAERGVPRCHFTRSCSQFLGLLMMTPDVPVSRDALYHCIYLHPDDEPVSNVLAVFLNLVRTVLEENDIQFRIETVRGFGMMLTMKEPL